MRYTEIQLTTGVEIFGVLVEARGRDEAEDKLGRLIHSLTGEWTGREARELEYAIRDQYDAENGIVYERGEQMRDRVKRELFS